jgi:hypothetical protein
MGVEDIICQIAQALIRFIADLIKAEDERSESFRLLTSINSTITEIAKTTRLYVLYPDQLETWRSALNSCEELVRNLHQTLMTRSDHRLPGAEMLQRIKFVVWDSRIAKTQMRKLEAHNINLQYLATRFVTSQFSQL